MAPMRLQKFLAKAGVCSRRRAEVHIREGRVRVNGETIAELGTKVDPDSDKVEFDGKTLSLVEEKLYIALNKPRGYVVSRKQPQEKTIMGLIRDVPSRVNPVGRLDKDSSGLLLLTNDGDLHNRLTHPSHDHEKEYLVTLKRAVTDQELEKLAGGIRLSDGPTRPARVRREDGKAFRIILKEGKNRQIRRMAGKIGHEVARLHRVRIGRAALGNLALGKWKKLSLDEIL